MNIKKILYISIVLFLLFICFQACSYRDIVVHDPSLAQNVSRLVKGQTTEAEVLVWFGVPDLQADGAVITLFPESAMGQYRAKKRVEFESINEKYVEINKKHSQKMPLFDPDYLYKIAMLQPYSSIDEKHVALLYLEFDQKITVAWVPTGAAYGKSSYRQNKLLIFINKKTGIVDEFSYRKEFKAD